MNFLPISFFHGFLDFCVYFIYINLESCLSWIIFKKMGHYGNNIWSDVNKGRLFWSCGQVYYFENRIGIVILRFFRNTELSIMIAPRNRSFLLFLVWSWRKIRARTTNYHCFFNKKLFKNGRGLVFWLTISSMKVLSMNILLIHSLYRKKNGTEKCNFWCHCLRMGHFWPNMFQRLLFLHSESIILKSVCM
jgi:heme exporter protein D